MRQRVWSAPQVCQETGLWGGDTRLFLFLGMKKTRILEFFFLGLKEIETFVNLKITDVCVYVYVEYIAVVTFI